ncbi:hypothetical protein [Actinomycetospora sp. TBRC 11914]|uniref:hypothetical protein n=1 Tax=Actinomycetospora sp. TBRC 11914 TaxID=2729387 RepID=UPI00145CC2A9|nr:hypothetical protein [Actinomycetospora sp. TBRC 11914]NMO92565.1 hypothetical protein [Actinomycetospora sp. TBRC 11914]
MSTEPSGTDEAEAVLTEAVRWARRLFGRGFRAAYAIGSLAHGGYAPGVSDVDLALVVRAAGPWSRARMRAVRVLTRWRRGPGPADRLSVFWGRWRDVRAGASGGVRLPAIDRLDLLEHGRLLAGTDRRAGAVPPSHEELVLDGARFAIGWYDDARLATLRDPAALASADARTVTKNVLFPVRFLATLHTGRAGANADAVRWYVEEHRGPASPLVAAAARWRDTGVGPEAAELLAEHLPTLHHEWAADHLRWLGALRACEH